MTNNPIEEYINSLEGKADLDPLAIARDLRELHMQEISTREATIEKLTGDVAAKDNTITERDSEITKWKAKNFELAMQIPDSNNPQENTRQEDVKPGGSNIQVSDLFNKSVRNRNPLLRNGS